MENAFRAFTIPVHVRTFENQMILNWKSLDFPLGSKKLQNLYYNIGTEHKKIAKILSLSMRTTRSTIKIHCHYCHVVTPNLVASASLCP